jgi:hydrogenase maturation protease
VRRAVVGVGSPFGGDRLGWWLVERLQPLLQGEAVELIKLDRPGAALAEWFSAFQQVILIDAVATAEEGEDLLLLDRTQLIACAEGRLSTHAIGVADAVSLAEVLGTLPEQFLCIGVPLSLAEQWEEEALQQRVVQHVADAVVKALK